MIENIIKNTKNKENKLLENIIIKTKIKYYNNTLKKKILKKSMIDNIIIKKMNKNYKNL